MMTTIQRIRTSGEGAAPAESGSTRKTRLGRGLALPRAVETIFSKWDILGFFGAWGRCGVETIFSKPEVFGSFRKFEPLRYSIAKEHLRATRALYSLQRCCASRDRARSAFSK